MNTKQNRPVPDKEEGVSWHPIDLDKLNWLYSGTSENDAERGCVGHLRGDFGSSGKEFWSTWFSHRSELQTPSFRNELQAVVDRLRKPGGLLSSFDQMRKQCKTGTSVDDSYGFHAETANYEYCLRCIPVRGSYHLYEFVKELGEGVDRVYRDMAEAGLPESEYRQAEFMLSATLKNKSWSNTDTAWQPGNHDGEHESGYQTGHESGHQTGHEALTETQKKLVLFCAIPRTRIEMMNHLGLSARSSFHEKNLKPLLQAGVLVMTNQANPKSKDQKYVAKR